MSDFLHLRKSENFTKCIKTGAKINTKYYTLYLLDNRDSHARLGISVSKKVSKLSVVRNFIKRQIRSWFYQNNFLLAHGFDLVVIPKKEFDVSNYKLLQDIFLQKLSERRLINIKNNVVKK